MQGTYIRIPTYFMGDKRIQPKERARLMAVYGSLWSFSGSGNQCYPSVGNSQADEGETICKRSGLGKNTVIKAKKKLISLGYISVKRNGQGKNDTYTLFETPNLNSDSQIEEFKQEQVVEIKTKKVHFQNSRHVQTKSKATLHEANFPYIKENKKDTLKEKWLGSIRKFPENTQTQILKFLDFSGDTISIQEGSPLRYKRLIESLTHSLVV
ncbi:helix-turn-helix domain-containing protein [Leptospira sp. 'Mane']|uniref:helix-turn-helix domain-containing protein n=1 Tax=Leptospira sp. 'Mane' TaxID=3387407 RepID=UPI00398BB705